MLSWLGLANSIDVGPIYLSFGRARPLERASLQPNERVQSRPEVGFVGVRAYAHTGRLSGLARHRLPAQRKGCGNEWLASDDDDGEVGAQLNQMSQPFPPGNAQSRLGGLAAAAAAETALPNNWPAPIVPL